MVILTSNLAYNCYNCKYFNNEKSFKFIKNND